MLRSYAPRGCPADNPLRRQAYQRRFWQARRFMRLTRPLARRVLSCGPVLVEREGS